MDCLSMLGSTTLPIIGGLSGFALWFTMLETDKMKGVLYRKDDNGNKVFTPCNAIAFIFAPFKYLYFWTTELIIHNWIVVTIGGVFCGFVTMKLFQFFL